MICYPDLNLSIKSNPNSSEMEESIIGFLTVMLLMSNPIPGSYSTV